MKPPETVTLIDLEGKPVVTLNAPETVGQQTIYCSLNETTTREIQISLMRGNFILKVVAFKIPFDGGESLVDFLNDQLTFIRNGMWETLAIYQATLGRYWEVPWYDVTWKEVCNFRAKQKIKGHCYKESSHKYKFRPYAKDFLKHYLDVFSKLPPWKESTNGNR